MEMVLGVWAKGLDSSSACENLLHSEHLKVRELSIRRPVINMRLQAAAEMTENMEDGSDGEMRW